MDERAPACPERPKRPKPPEERHTEAVRALTYNIRHAQGLDGRVSNARIAETIRGIAPDLAGLNEVWRMARRFEQPAEIARLAGMEHVFTQAHRWGPLIQGNAVLSATSIGTVDEVRLPRGLENRGCLLVETEVDGARVRFGTTHLSLGRGHRTRQLRALAEALPNDLPLVLVGDFNAESDELAPLRERFTVVDDPPATYSPSHPRKALDHIVFSPDWELVSLETIPSRASDHLPLVAELRLR